MLQVKSPADGGLVGEVAVDDVASVTAKVSQARVAQSAWAQVPLAQRMACVSRFAQALQQQGETLARTLSAETGKPITQARSEIAATVPRVRWFLQHAPKVLDDEVVHRDQGIEERITYEPLGVVLNVSAWNYPYFVGTNVFVPALLCGCAVLYKPSELATLSGLCMTRLMHEAGVPNEVFAPVVGGGDVGAALLQTGGDGVFFTGSYATGMRVATAAAQRLMHVQLELGGKDAVYVLDDADVDAAAAALAEGAFYNTGQSCCAVERIYVHRAVYSAFLARFVAVVRDFVVGDPSDAATFIGPVTRPAQLKVLQAQVDEAVQQGGRVLCGGTVLTRPGSYFAPTVVADAPQSCALMQQESFGPMVGVRAVDGDEEAIACINDSAYGLTAGVFGRDAGRATAILRQLHTGSVYFNCCDRVSPHLPWSGRRHSGLGATLSQAGIRAFVLPKAWHWRK